MKRVCALALLLLSCVHALPARADIALPRPRVVWEKPFADAVVIRMEPVWNSRGNNTGGVSVGLRLDVPGPCDYALTLHPAREQRPDIRHEGSRTEFGPYTTRLDLDVPRLAAGEVVEYRVDARVTLHRFARKKREKGKTGKEGLLRMPPGVVTVHGDDYIYTPRDRNGAVLTATHSLVFSGEREGKVGLYFDGNLVRQFTPGAGAAGGQKRDK